MMSFDVESLFTSVPIEPSIAIIKKLLEDDKSLHQRTNMTVNQISCLEFCLKTTYFIFQGKIFEQVKGAAVGSPISPMVANLFMEDLEIKALSIAPRPPTLWKRFVDGTFIIIQRRYKESFLQHLNSIDDNIHFNCEQVKTTYFIFQGKIFEQVKGAAMGSPISPMVANLFMEDLAIKALSIAPRPPTLWKRFVDDTFIIIHRRYKESFLQHLNSIDDNIHFTCEEAQEDGSIALLDMLISPDENGRLNTSVYRKATHTD